MAFAIRIDISRCIGCRACEVACVTANDLDPAHSRTWVPHLERGSCSDAQSTFAPYLCMHCEDPFCVPACPTGASYKASDGRVLVDKDLCIGCGLCVPACPYEARFVDPASNTLDKCTLCDGRVRQGLAPACFEVCPAQARLYREGGLTVGDVEAVDPGHEVVRRVDDDLDPGPTLRVSGRPEDLNLLEKELPLKRDEAIPAALWRDGAGLMVQGLGMASILAMAGMLSLRVLRGRRGQDAGSGPDETIHDGENTHG